MTYDNLPIDQKPYSIFVIPPFIFLAVFLEALLKIIQSSTDIRNGIVGPRLVTLIPKPVLRKEALWKTYLHRYSVPKMKR